jgi:hypothetical protein
MLLPGRDDCAPAARSQLTKISSIFFNNNVILLQQEESLPVVEAPDGNTRWLEHDPEKREPVFPRDKCEAFARRSCSNKEI